MRKGLSKPLRRLSRLKILFKKSKRRVGTRFQRKRATFNGWVRLWFKEYGYKEP